MNQAAGSIDDGVDREAEAASETGLVAAEARAHQRQAAVILRETFGQPQFAGDVGVLKVKRFERTRAEAFDIPAVKVFMRDGAQITARPAFDRARTGQAGG